MVYPNSIAVRWTRGMHRVHARLAALANPATGFVSQPEPRTVGSFARGRQLIAGNYLFAGYLVEGGSDGIWDVPPPAPVFTDALHGFRWLDDLAAVGDATARKQAQDWLWTWIDRSGRGKGQGWTPDLTGRRVIRWIHHALFVLSGQDKTANHNFYKSLAQQAIFLSRRWHTALPGLPRFEALTGLIYAGLSLQGMEKVITPSVRALERECKGQIDHQGGLPTRNPEELLEVFTLLTWVVAALEETGHEIQPELRGAITRIAPTLRTLRHADGGLARFHGGGRGAEGLLDSALAASGIKGRNLDGLSMGFARLSAGRTSVIIDAAPPPQADASHDAHASTLAFELTSGRRPVVVNCGSGASLGTDWRRAGRATASHSVLSLSGYSSARMGRGRGRNDCLIEVPENVLAEIEPQPNAIRFQGAQDGYLRTHGLTHARTMQLSLDGRSLEGEDLLFALENEAKHQFDKSLDNTSLQGIPFDIRFHLHPDVDATLDMGGTAVSLAIKSGEIWVFRHESKAKLSLEPSVYLENGRLRPRATKQIVLSSRAMDYASRTRWSLAKAQDTPLSIRDTNRDELDLTD